VSLVSVQSGARETAKVVVHGAHPDAGFCGRAVRVNLWIDEAAARSTMVNESGDGEAANTIVGCASIDPDWSSAR
jgi:hypothetical protein